MRRLLILFGMLILLLLPSPIWAAGEKAATILFHLNMNGTKKTVVFSATLGYPGIDSVPPVTPRDVHPLIAQLASDSEESRARAAMRLVRYGDKAVAPLAQVLKSANARQRLFVGLALAVIDSKASLAVLRTMPVAPLLQGMHAKDVKFVHKCAFLLAIVGGEKALPELRRQLHTSQDSSLVTIILGGAILGHQRALLPAMESCLRAPESRVRIYSIAANFFFLHEQARGKFLALLPDPDKDVRFTLLLMLSQMRCPRVDNSMATLLLSDPEPRLRATAATLLYPTQDPGIINSLIIASRLADAGIRKACAQTLGGCKSTPAILKALHTLEKDSDPGVKNAATKALKKMEG